MTKTTRIIASTIVGAMVLLQGCSGSSVKQKNLANVTSNPSGATVYANILELGKTPLRHNLFDAFPAGWQNSVYQAQGILIVKKEGCDDFTLKVTDHILRNPIHAELKCSETSKTKESMPVVKSGVTATVAPTVTPTATQRGGTEKRLVELEALYKKGVITKDEYKTTRERILNEH
jgi:hypothetical protein